MKFSIFVFFVFATIALVIYSVALETGRRYHKKQLEEKLEKQKQRIEDFKRCRCPDIASHGRAFVFEQLASLSESNIAGGDLAGAEKLLNRITESFDAMLALHDEELTSDLVRFALSLFNSYPPTAHLVMDLGMIEPAVADSVQAELLRQGYRTLLTLNPAGRYLLVRTKPGCGPVHDCTC